MRVEKIRVVDLEVHRGRNQDCEGRPSQKHYQSCWSGREDGENEAELGGGRRRERRGRKGKEGVLRQQDSTYSLSLSLTHSHSLTTATFRRSRETGTGKRG